MSASTKPVGLTVEPESPRLRTPNKQRNREVVIVEPDSRPPVTRIQKAKNPNFVRT